LLDITGRIKYSLPLTSIVEFAALRCPFITFCYAGTLNFALQLRAYHPGDADLYMGLIDFGLGLYSPYFTSGLLFKLSYSLKT
jgi:hypothetical protein